MRQFFITGLPRSGTAWLSVFLTSSNSFCFHEAEKYGDMGSMMLSRNEPVVGNASPGNAISHQAMYPDARYVVVRRDIDTCKASVIKAGVPGELLWLVDAAARYLPDFVRKHDPLIVEFDDLWRGTETLQRIWEHCIGDGFDRQRAEMLQRLRISTDVQADLSNIDQDELNQLKRIGERL